MGKPKGYKHDPNAPIVDTPVGPRRVDGRFVPGVDSAKGVRNQYSEEEKAECKAIFLTELDKRFNQTFAHRAAGVPKRQIYLWMKEDPEFKRQRQEIIDSHIDNVQESLYQKAMSDSAQATLAAIAVLNAWRTRRYKPESIKGPQGNGQVNVHIHIGEKPRPALPSGGSKVITAHAISSLDDDEEDE